MNTKSPWSYPQTDRALVELTGEDRLTWLQGQATNDLRNLVENQPRGFCLCKATGQMEAVCEAWEEGGRLLVSTDLRGRDVLLHRVDTMVILEDVAARDLTDSYRAWLVGDPIREVWSPIGTDGPSGLPELTAEEFQAVRIRRGIPLRGVDFTEKTLPPELGPDFESRHVSYAKGCYMGQEVLMRIHSRGHTNRSWVGLLSESPMARGDVVKMPSGEEVGEVTSTAGNIATAMLRNEATEDGAMVLVNGAEATVRTLPID